MSSEPFQVEVGSKAGTASGQAAELPSVDPAPAGSSWQPWRVAPDSGFEVQQPTGYVGLLQRDRQRFDVEHPFRFSDPRVVALLTDRLIANGMTPAQASAAVEDARTYSPGAENPTDLASIPRYMRWFESSYGLHTLAAIIHDDLIVTTPNGGALQDDTLSDRFFREMMRSAGVPWLKRWIMWSAVALRTRWAVGGIRRTSVLIWLLLSTLGISGFVWAVLSLATDWDSPTDAWVLLLASGVLPFAAAGLWGKQYGAGIIAAIAALWILPAAVLAGFGYLVYLALERVVRLVGLD